MDGSTWKPVHVHKTKSHRVGFTLLCIFLLILLVSAALLVILYKKGNVSDSEQLLLKNDGCPVGSVPGISGCVQCQNAADCPNGSTCNEKNRCVPMCAADTACAAGKCVNGICKECSNDSHCPDPLVCGSDGTCVECANDNNCVTGQKCHQGMCKSVCWAPGHTATGCPEGEMCEPSLGHCVPCTTEHNTCSGATPVCVANKCVQCDTNSQCPTFQTCSDNVCRSTICGMPMAESSTVSPFLLVSGSACISVKEGVPSTASCNENSFRQWFAYMDKGGHSVLQHVMGGFHQGASTLSVSQRNSATFVTSGSVEDHSVTLVRNGYGFMIKLGSSFWNATTMTWTRGSGTVFQAKYLKESACHDSS